MADRRREVAIIGGGIGGLTLALELHARGIPFRIYEAAPEFRPLGVGLNLLPHAIKALNALGLQEALLERGIETREYRFYTRHGQLVQSEERGRYAGYEWPQISIHRGDLHEVLVNAVLERGGPDSIRMGHRCVDVDQTGDHAIVKCVDAVTGEPLPDATADVAIACDGVHSIVRTKFHPDEAVPRYEGTMNYRGTTRWKPFLTGQTMIYMGTTETGKLILYPIRDDIDAEGNQLINWVIELQRPSDMLLRDWNRTSDINEFIGNFEDCDFDFLNIPALMRAADHVFEYPMCDQEPLNFWTVGRITLLGDAAHPMMPRGSNGAAQAILDAEVLSDLLAKREDWPAALKDYEKIRLGATSSVVLANRDMAPDAILRVVDERTGGKPFANIDDVVSPEERDAWQSRYKQTVGFAVDQLK